ncbi:MAG: hypothetical protein ACKOED_12625 [Aestuariivirga sp.]|uniref:hypothetical protein n=1 Tax=Aestuariivirga sp. TaxID=2650926 RepID=UPI0038D203C0
MTDSSRNSTGGIAGSSLASAHVEAAASQSGGNTVLDFGSLGTVTLTDVALTKLVAHDFVFG